MLVFSIISLVLSLLGNLFVVKKSIVGYYLWIISNIFWIIINVVQKSYPQALMFVAYTAINLYGIKEWSRKDD